MELRNSAAAAQSETDDEDAGLSKKDVRGATRPAGTFNMSAAFSLGF